MGAIEYGMVGWHLQISGDEFEQALGVVDGQGSLACYSPWGCKESDMTERLNITTTTYIYVYMCVSLCGQRGREDVDKW